MATLLFWNLNKKDLVKEVTNLCKTYDVDILMLAELSVSDVAVLSSLNFENNRTYFALFNNLSSRLKFFFRYPPECIEPVSDEGGYISIRKLSPPIGNSLLIAGVHLSSKLYMTADDQKFQAVRIAEIIREAEVRVGHERTIAIGDFNMNPFEVGVVSSDCFHAVMDKNIARKRSRSVQGKDKLYFYNPMWGRMGDTSLGPPGTYYYSNSGYVNYFWNTFDQVLLRPELLDFFSPNNLTVISEIDGEDLLKSGYGISNSCSDHLPIVVKLEIEKMNYEHE